MPTDDVLEVEDAPDTAPADLRAVAALGAKMKTLEDEIAELEAALKLKRDAHRIVSEVELPTAILSVGLRAVPLADGTMIEVVTAYHSSISEANRPAAHEWLRDHGRGDYIKRAVAVQFGQGEGDLAVAAATWLRTQYPQHKIDDKEAVHASTLKAFIGREMTAGNPNGVPEDLFSIHTRRYAQITDTTTKQLKKKSDASEEF